MKNAQGSLEYLLIIGVVILIAAVVIGVLTGVLSFGRLSASREQADSVYTGLQDVMDLSKGRTLLNLKLKQGENVLEFNDTVRKTIWTIFGNLPENSQIIFSGATCKDNPTLTEIDANKKPEGSGSAYFQNDDGTNTIVNLCVVPTNTQVTINVPEDTEINIPIEKEGASYIIFDESSGGYIQENDYIDPSYFHEMLTKNPEGDFKLKKDVGSADHKVYLENSIDNFEGTIEGIELNEFYVTINSYDTYIFTNLKNTKITNVNFFIVDTSIAPVNNCTNSTFYYSSKQSPPYSLNSFDPFCSITPLSGCLITGDNINCGVN